MRKTGTTTMVDVLLKCLGMGLYKSVENYMLSLCFIYQALWEIFDGLLINYSFSHNIILVDR